MGLLESRPLVQVMFLSRFLAGAALTGRVGAHVVSVAAGAVAWSAAAVAVYVFNGIMDVAEDRGNGSRRPIASGRLSRANATAFTGCAAALALAIGTTAGITVHVLLFLGLGYLYSGPPRAAKRAGAAACAVIAALGLATFWAGARAAHGHSAAVVVFGLVMSGWMGLVGALAKDIADVPGDALAGRRTFAVRYGITPVARCAAALAVAVAVAGDAAAALTAPVLLPSMLILTLGACRVAGDCRSLAGETPRNPYRSFMATQYATIAALGITLFTRHAI
ncbi:UbiA family prenyltransferase [Microbispora sp. H10670]|uniref:UbiA family prenyltransferase n=1 Tax=Microbispora sp. H10670 TaxID=2729108 RepID=UPI0016027109|nr:UbiA family prenyltransferase [Microbispora sp. H10670]